MQHSGVHKCWSACCCQLPKADQCDLKFFRVKVGLFLPVAAKISFDIPTLILYKQ